MDWRTVLQAVFEDWDDDTLSAVRLALERDDPRLQQGRTCEQDAAGKPVAACLIGFAGWVGCGLKTRDEIEGYFLRASDQAHKRMQRPFSMLPLTGYFDATPRAKVFAEVLAEVERETARRAVQTSAQAG